MQAGFTFVRDVIKIDRKNLIIAAIMLVVGIMLGRYLFGARGDVSDIEKRIDSIGQQVSGAGGHIDSAGQSIERAAERVVEVERGFVEVKAGAERGKVLVGECREIVNRVKERGPVAR